MTKTAKVVARGAHRDWCCPTCGKLLGQIYDDRIIIKVRDRFIEAAVSADLRQSCPVCSTQSAVPQETAA